MRIPRARCTVPLLLSVLPLALPTAAQPGAPAALPEIASNDNRPAAGRRGAAGLKVHLEVRRGNWRPHGLHGPALPVLAFAEQGRTPQNPGPLLRARTGEPVEATVENRSDVPLTVFGLGSREGAAPDSFAVAPGERRTVRFRAPAAGTYYYAAVRSGNPLMGRFEEDSQLNGMFVVDPPERERAADDRFFLISWWFQDPDPTGADGRPALGTMVINGLSWPHTERLRAATGETQRWRWVNLTEAPHPMHLHGFYFRVEARGDGMRDTLYTPQQQRLAVTERIGFGETATLSWTPERPGNWLFHCHFAFHISHNVGLVPQADFSDRPPHGDHMESHGMAGLALGIQVVQRGPRLQPVSARATRPLRLLIESRAGVYGENPGYSYRLDGEEPRAGLTPLPVPGPTLVLEQHQPVAVTIVNRSHEPAAVHWHGIELESFPDGVPGWSGEGNDLLRPITPADSLTVRFTPPRAGTFMYHSHLNELQQIASGLYGALLVLPPGERLDRTRDHTLLFSTGGIPSRDAPILLNGEAQPRPLMLQAGVTHRLRFINIMANGGALVELLREDRPVEWTPVAKDGADLPEAQRTARPARTRIVAGETYDFAFTPHEPGLMVLRYRGPERQPVLVGVRVVGPEEPAP